MKMKACGEALLKICCGCGLKDESVEIVTVFCVENVLEYSREFELIQNYWKTAVNWTFVWSFFESFVIEKAPF